MAFEPKIGKKVDISSSTSQSRGEEIVKGSSHSDKSESFLGGLVRNIARPYGELASTVTSAAKGVYGFGKAGIQYAQGDKEEALQTALRAGQGQTIFGYEPFQSAKQAVGAGAEIGISAIGLKTPAPTSLKAATVEGAKFGAGFGASKSLQEDPKEAIDPTDLLLDTVVGAGVGAASGAAGYGIQKLAQTGYRVLKGFFKRGAGFASSATQDAVEQIAKNPKEANKYIGDKSVDILEDVSKSIQTGVNTIQKEASDEYGKALQSVPTKNIGNINKKDILGSLNKAIGKYDLKIDSKSGTISGFNKSALSDKEAKVVTKLFNQITDWEDISPAGLVELTKKMQTFKRYSETYTKSDTLITKTISSIRDYISEKIDSDVVKAASKDYSIKQQLLEVIRRQIGVAKGFLSKNDLITVSQKLSTIYNANKEVVNKFLTEFEQQSGESVLTPLAVREVTKAPTKFNLKSGGLEDLVQVIIPKEFTAKLITTLGIAEQNATALINTLNSIAPGKRVALFNIITQLTQQK